MAEYFLAVGSGGVIDRSLDGKTWAQVFSDTPNNPEWYNITLGEGAKVLVSGNPNQAAPNCYTLLSLDDGQTYHKVLIAPFLIDAGFEAGNTINTYIIPDAASKNGQGMIWNGTQFAANEQRFNILTPTSPDGETWFTTGAAALLVTGRNTSGVWNAATNKYYVWILQNTVSNLCSSPDMITFTNLYQTGSQNGSPYIFQNGTDIIAFGANDGVDTGILVSHDNGATFAFHANHLILNDQSGSPCVIFDSISGLYFILAFNNETGLDQGIYSSADAGDTWTPRKTDPAGTAPFLRGICRTGPGAPLAATGDSGVFFTSADNGSTWTEVGTQWEAPDNSVSNKWLFHHDDYYITLLSDSNTGDQSFATSPDGLSTNWTPQFVDNHTINQFIGFDNPGPAPGTGPCVDFEIQSPGDMPDAGQQFTGQRLLLTVNCNVSGVPQTLTPILIIDGVEHTLPPITTMKRETVDMPIYGYHGRFFDGVRLEGCLTGRVEVFRIEATIALGNGAN